MHFNIVKSQLSTSEFIQLMAEQFPAIKDDVLDEDYDGLITLQVRFLANYANKCISTGRLDEVRRVLNFFEAVLPKVDIKVDNALHVSFLEHLDLDKDTDHAREATKLLSRELLSTYRELRNWLNKPLR